MPRAIPRIARSAALVVRQIQPCRQSSPPQHTVVAVQALGGWDVAFRHRVRRRQGCGAGADVIGERREVQGRLLRSRNACRFSG